MHIPTLIQEQNSFPGITNKVLASKVDRICVAFKGMSKYFPENKIVLTGNPVRKDILNVNGKREEAIRFFGLDPSLATLLVIGGSLGARTINESILAGMKKLEQAGLQVIWQTGKGMEKELVRSVQAAGLKHIQASAFIQRMDLAYAAADLVVSRAGAISVSEICVAGKACILVPSPNVAEDHQTKNAKALTEKDAAVFIADSEAREKLVGEALKLLFDEHRAAVLSKNIMALAKPRATEDIVNEIEKLIGVAHSTLSAVSA
jgi:UDP-N-acetylglucosamine--N-acetylmuramyl-(pentapeptide) pyrophosphoryl-undecaprenol N-acetylglucosamine transferase